MEAGRIMEAPGIGHARGEGIDIRRRVVALPGNETAVSFVIFGKGRCVFQG